MSKVLIIEDDVPYQKVYKRKFEASGYTVEVAGDGIEGLEKMRSFQPDIVFLDIMMPKKDGFQVLDEAKADAAIKDIPIVVMTNLSTDDDNQKLEQKGAIDVIIKSNNEPNVLVVKAQKVLEQKANTGL
ncbi:MAG TPA: response regulator [Candidatus Saccharimonadales bacterium]